MRLYLGVIYISLPVSFLLTSVHVVGGIVGQGGDEKEKGPQTERHAAAIPLVAVRSFAVCDDGQDC